jgi:hypothetical protein
MTSQKYIAMANNVFIINKLLYTHQHGRLSSAAIQAGIMTN